MWMPSNDPSYMDFVAVSSMVNDRVGWIFGYVQEYDDDDGDLYIMRRETYADVAHPRRDDEVRYAKEMKVKQAWVYRAVWTVLGPVAILGTRIGPCE